VVSSAILNGALEEKILGTSTFVYEVRAVVAWQCSRLASHVVT